MIQIFLLREGPAWFGCASHDEELVATSVAVSRERVLDDLERSLPSGIPYRVMSKPTAFAAEKLRLLAALEAGDEREKRFELSRAYVREPLRSVLLVASTIPLGFVSTYGNVASRAGTEARVVGQAMGGNILYPIVPCHRVVGADLSLVGYGRRQDMDALCAKLGRLRRETRGFTEETFVPGSSLRVYPVEWAIAKALKDGVETARQLSLFG